MRFEALTIFPLLIIKFPTQIFKIGFLTISLMSINLLNAQSETVDKSNYKKESLTDTLSYFGKAKLSLLSEDYQMALKNAYKISESNLKSNSFAINRIKAIAHSSLHRIDSSLIYANTAIKQNKNAPLKYEMIDLYGVLAWNYFKNNDLNIANKYCQLTVKALRVSELEEKEKIRLMRKYRLASIIGLKASRDRENQLKNNLILIIIGSILIISLLLLYSTKKRKKLKLKLEIFKHKLDELKESSPIKKEKIYTIDDETIKRILDGLDNIENTVIFTDKDFNLNVLAKLLATNTSYLSRIINEQKKQTFKQYLNDLRITFLIKNLDENPILRKYSIEALAATIGYTNASSFTRIFKNHIGTSPSEYLKNKYS